MGFSQLNMQSALSSPKKIFLGRERRKGLRLRSRNQIEGKTRAQVSEG